MFKTLTRHGNSFALIVDKAILELLKIDPDCPLEITTDGKSLTITPVSAPERSDRFDNALKQTNRKYNRALKKLAE